MSTTKVVVAPATGTVAVKDPYMVVEVFVVTVKVEPKNDEYGLYWFGSSVTGHPCTAAQSRLSFTRSKLANSLSFLHVSVRAAILTLSTTVSTMKGVTRPGLVARGRRGGSAGTN